MLNYSHLLLKATLILVGLIILKLGIDYLDLDVVSAGPIIAAFALLQVMDIRGIFLVSLIPGAIAVMILIFLVYYYTRNTGNWNGSYSLVIYLKYAYLC